MTTRRFLVPTIIGALLIASSFATLGAPFEEAPPPRAAEETRCHPRSHVARNALSPEVELEDTELMGGEHGVQWRAKAGLGKLKNGTDVVELHWSMRYVGPRPPLIIQRPSLTDVFYPDTIVYFCAFPPGKEEGRRLRFAAKVNPEKQAWYFMGGGYPDDYFLIVEKGETARGVLILPVATLKDALRSRYPAEFPADSPPKFYADFVHVPSDRGGADYVDAWTGKLRMPCYLEVPDLKKW